MRKSLSDVSYVQHLEGKIHELVVGAYVSSFQAAFIGCLGIAAVSFIISLALKERRI